MTVFKFQNDGLDRLSYGSAVIPYFDEVYRQTVIAQPCSIPSFHLIDFNAPSKFSHGQCSFYNHRYYPGKRFLHWHQAACWRLAKEFPWETLVMVRQALYHVETVVDAKSRSIY
jgi:hypothetical protein